MCAELVSCDPSATGLSSNHDLGPQVISPVRYTLLKSSLLKCQLSCGFLFIYIHTKYLVTVSKTMCKQKNLPNV